YTTVFRSKVLSKQHLHLQKYVPFYLTPFKLITCSKTCTAFKAAPFSKLSEVHQTWKVLSNESSRRILPTNISSLPVAFIASGYSFCSGLSISTTRPSLSKSC